jgi:ADP-ribose pyrophosphatase YjhB (NUDIX family)
MKFVPVVKRTMGYIVGAIVFNEENTHVLLVQEAKAKCRGLWYYPVGRLEPKESLVVSSTTYFLDRTG